MISLMDMQKVGKNLTPVTSSDFVMGKGNVLHPEGLFSEVIFGHQESPERKLNYSFIELNCKVLHPALHSVFRRVERKILEAIERKNIFSIDSEGNLVSDPKGNIDGITSVIENFDKIHLRSEDNQQRADLVKMLELYHKKDMVFLSRILVIPAYYRDIEMDPISKTMRVDPLNDYYVKILRLSLQLQPLQNGDVFEVLSARMNQLVLDIYEFFTSKLGKKHGLIRGNVLGKRADFTARGVITGAAAEIKVDEIGVPFRMLVKMYEPFILHDLLKSGNVTQSDLSHALREYNATTLSIPTLRSLITGIYKGDELTTELETILKSSVIRVIKDKVVLAKRDPAINSESVQGFKPVMVDGSTIKLNILKCSGFNADFDGDSCISFVTISYGENKQKWSGLISDLECLSTLGLNQYECYTKDNGIKVTKFKPSVDIFIQSINLDTSDVSEKKITDYSKHENLVMYKIHDTGSRFKDFWVSEDHSLILYSSITKQLRKESPKNVNKITDYLVQKNGDNPLLYISVQEVEISIDPEKTVGYDFTVEDNFTFCTDDGVFIQDTMALYAPITKEAIDEAKDKMISSISPSGMGTLSDDFSKDIVIGLYGLTRDTDSSSVPILIKDDADVSNMDIYTPVKHNGIVTTAGRILFNRGLPEKYAFVNEPINKKKLNKISNDIYSKYEKQEYVEFCYQMVVLGSKYYTTVAPSFTLDDLEIPSAIIKLKQSLAGQTAEQADKTIKEIEKKLQEYCEKNDTNFGFIGQAGGLKGGYSQTRQIMVAKGLIQDSSGNALPPIVSSFSDGLSSKEYFDSGIGARSGIINRVISTASTGYLSRQLVYALQRVEADPGLKDCGTKRYFKLLITSDLAKILRGRFIMINGRTVPFDAEKHTGHVVELRSPLYCLSDRMCYSCYGDLLLRNRTHYVGVLAGHLLGEPLTQTIMRQFHTGGSVTIKTVNVLDEITKTLSEKEKAKIHEYVAQKEYNVSVNKSCKIIINTELYLDSTKDIITDDEDKTITLKYGYFNIDVADIQIEITLDATIIIDIKDKKVTKVNDHTVEIDCPANSIIFSVPPITEAFSQQIRIIGALLSGRKPWRSADHFTMKLYDFYKDLRTMDLVHIEVLASNLLRDKNNPSYPARLNKAYNPTIGSLKSIPALESWLQSLNFENINKSITQGLVYDRPEQETILERIVTGNL